MKFEKGACLIPSPDTDWVLALRHRLTRWAHRMRLDRLWSPEMSPSCDRAVTVSLAADTGARGFKEEVVLRTSLQAWLRYQEGSARDEFRRKVWEAVEIFLSHSSKDQADLAQRLRVVEVAGDLTREVFLQRRKSILATQLAFMPQTTVSAVLKLGRLSGVGHRRVYSSPIQD